MLLNLQHNQIRIQMLRQVQVLTSPRDSQDLDKNKRNSIIREVCKQGAGFRQLAQITGISYGIIQRVVTDQSPLI